jgi:hypothetical protein
MNNVLLTFMIMFLSTTTFVLIANFFDISMFFYLPYLIWIIALCIFNIVLDRHHTNIYMQKLSFPDKD